MKYLEPWIMMAGLAIILGLVVWYAFRQTEQENTITTSPQSLCERLNNPGCIKDNGITVWLGSDGEENGFVRFKEPLWGIRAMAIILRTYRQKHGLHTIEGIVTRWAPPSENGTQLYIDGVSQLTGIQPNVTLRTNNDYVQVIRAMIRVELGKMPYSTETIRSAVTRAQVV